MEVYGLSIGPHNVSTAFTSICSGLAGTKVCTKRKEHIMEHCCLIQHCLMLDIPRPFWGPSYSVSTEVFWCCVALRELHPKTAGWYGFASTWGTPSNPIYVVYRLVLCWECVSLGYTCLDKHIQTHIHSVWTEDPVMCSRGNILNSKLEGPTCSWVFFLAIGNWESLWVWESNMSKGVQQKLIPACWVSCLSICSYCEVWVAFIILY